MDKGRWLTLCSNACLELTKMRHVAQTKPTSCVKAMAPVKAGDEYTEQRDAHAVMKGTGGTDQ